MNIEEELRRSTEELEKAQREYEQLRRVQFGAILLIYLTVLMVIIRIFLK